MEEENIDEKIEKGVRLLALKKKEIESWEQEETFRKHRRRIRSYWIGGAASVAIISTVALSYYSAIDNEIKNNGDSPFSYEVQLSNNSVEMSTIDEEVEALMEMRKYGKAIEAIETYLRDTIEDSSHSAETPFSDKSVQHSEIYELEWMKIQCLIRLNRPSEAEELLKRYISIDSGHHQQEAKQLLESLNGQK